MKKIMISQPMKGKTNEQIRKEREMVIHQLELNGYDVVDTIINEEPPNIDEAIYFMKGWEKARGCKIEHQVAVEYDKEVMYEN